jgi:hypothetical protein
MNKQDRYEQIRDTMEAFMAECREHGTTGYAMSSGYLQATVKYLLESVTHDRLEHELEMMRKFTRDQAHRRTISALQQSETA